MRLSVSPVHPFDRVSKSNQRMRLTFDAVLLVSGIRYLLRIYPILMAYSYFFCDVLWSSPPLFCPSIDHPVWFAYDNMLPCHALTFVVRLSEGGGCCMIMYI